MLLAEPWNITSSFPPRNCAVLIEDVSTGEAHTVGNAEIFRSLSEILAVEFPVFYEQLWLKVAHVKGKMY